MRNQAFARWGGRRRCCCSCFSSAWPVGICGHRTSASSSVGGSHPRRPTAPSERVDLLIQCTRWDTGVDPTRAARLAAPPLVCCVVHA